jgi:hypothetical protein
LDLGGGLAGKGLGGNIELRSASEMQQQSSFAHP